MSRAIYAPADLARRGAIGGCVGCLAVASERSAGDIPPATKGPIVLFACGGTAGHVHPALAIAEELGRRGVADVRFVGSSNRMEGPIIRRNGYRMDTTPCAPMHRPLVSLRNAWRLAVQAAGVLVCLLLLVRSRPRVVVGTGGYVTVPACVAAWLLRIPIVMHESNAVPGLATRLLVNRLKAPRRVFLGFNEATKHLQTDR